MHRLQHDKPDWANVPASARNSWQRIAVATHGYGTLGNAITLSGLVLSLIGVSSIHDGRLIAGVCLLGIGRFADILDGYAAEHTKTKSRIGEALDATSDKIMALVTVLVFAVGHVIPLGPLLFIFLHSLTNIALSTTARLRGRELHPSDAGKYATILEWLMLLCFVATRIFTKQHVFATNVSNVIAYLLLVITIIPAVTASIGYGQQALSPHKPLQ